MIVHSSLRFLLAASVAASIAITPGSARAQAVDVPLTNPDFKDGDGDGLPDGWKPAPGGDGTTTIIKVDGGALKFTDNSEGVGLGLAQWVDVNPGDEYTATANLEGTGSVMFLMVFVPKVPAREGDMNKVKIGEAKISLPAKDGVTELKAVAPAGATKARVMLYCPKIGKCDVTVKSVSLKKTGSGPAPTPIPSAAAAGPTPKPRNDHGRDHPDSMIQPGTVAKIDFETGDFSQVRLQEGGKKEVVSAPEPVRSGQHAMKVMLTHDQHRTEVTGPRSQPYGEFKYGWSIYLPKEFDGNSWFSIITQWHTWGSGKEYVINPPGPPTCLTVSKGNWDFLLRYQDGDTDNAAGKHFDFGPIEPDLGRWVDFVMEVNWQSPKSGGGYLKLWKDGKLVVDYTGPTWFEDKTSGPFFKMGIYKGAGSWKGEESGAIAYFDEFRMGDKSIPHDAVDPAKQAGK